MSWPYFQARRVTWDQAAIERAAKAVRLRLDDPVLDSYVIAAEALRAGASCVEDINVMLKANDELLIPRSPPRVRRTIDQSQSQSNSGHRAERAIDQSASMDGAEDGMSPYQRELSDQPEAPETEPSTD